ncbi:hypothetical protein F0U61_54075 [Archangium violaceum]|nr:hypothetical protein F0U61_54075 [Archangium violaceum]
MRRSTPGLECSESARNPQTHWHRTRSPAGVELVGACWMPHELKAPSPDALFENQGKCYAPTFSAKPPQSVGQ